MKLKQLLKSFPGFYNLILLCLNNTNYFNFQFYRRYKRYQITPYWQQRINRVTESNDNIRIRHVEDAGKIFDKYQLMHNGVRITLGSYYDLGNTKLLEKNRGVHEPQEEFVFQEILPYIPSGGNMMELGSYWAYYSLWFAASVKDARCFMIEPDPHKMNFGKLNFRLNHFKGNFTNGFVDGYSDLKRSVPVYNVDTLLEKYQIKFLNILHSDIQGFEYNMLKGAENALNRKRVGYIFISTHSNELHQNCIEHLKDKGYMIVCEADLDKSFSVDGLIVAKLPDMPGPSEIKISKYG